ncbi:hypothetical protein [Aliikangiella coralliicola]|uniref:DUF4345 domain-containing protein n=1 Tax=Aliikangiella coralliicola TaxID=2592383 RepID=A0A545UDQ4_9GAMM|nr:hypothetical protein [Aliikangiella coralliicola]TQV87588.1 hypothetical protein FLL46_12010 [Aliikangiella coralliicola]
MIRFAQVLSAIFVVILLSAAITSIFFPEAINAAGGFNVTTDYGKTNLRTLGAPLLSLAIITIFAIYRKEWLLLLPASLYFFFNGSARVISLFNEQYDPVMIRGLVFTFSLFVLSQVALHIFRRASKDLNSSH